MDFDAIVLGTGLSESIAAAALSKAGFKVAHVDNNQYYGGDEASLTLDELAEWADIRSGRRDASSSDYLAAQKARYTSISRSETIPPQARQYAVSLAPSIVPSIGPHIEALIASGVSRYGSFKLLEKVAVYDRPGLVQSVPGSKEDVFKSKVLSLIDKRRLMRFLMFAAGEFEGKKELEGKEQTPFVQYLREVFALDEKAVNAIAYALAFCTSGEEPTLPALQRIRQYLRSTGRYGPSPFLVGHYGGCGETAQGFCRTSAVKGGTYILGRRVLSVKSCPNLSDNPPEDEKDNSRPSKTTPRYEVRLEDIDEQLTSTALVSAPDYIPLADSSSQDGPSSFPTPHRVARCIAVLDRPLVFTPVDAPEDTTPPAPETEESVEGAEDEPSDKPEPPDYEVDTALLVFPPGTLQNGSTAAVCHALITGEASMSAPRGKFILNISLPLSETEAFSSEELLRPYLDAALSLTAPPSRETSPATPLFTVFYTHNSTLSRPSPTANSLPSAIITPPPPPLLPVIADAATGNAEAMFWKAVEQLKAAGVRRSVVKETVGKAKEGGEEPADAEESQEIDSFWPPLDATEDDSSTADEW